MKGTNKLVAMVITAFLGLGMMSATAMADEEKAPGTGPNPFTDCGIGAALFPNTHWAAVTSNVIWDIGTTAVISATASPETCQGGSALAARFINEVYDSVLADTARGDGDHLVALMEIYGCESSVQGDIVNAIRSDVGTSISADGYTSLEPVEKAEQLFHIVDSEIQANYSTSCTA
ncbi:MAG: DUF3015 family protein [Pseudomonadota bacterium]